MLGFVNTLNYLRALHNNAKHAMALSERRRVFGNAVVSSGIIDLQLIAQPAFQKNQCLLGNTADLSIDPQSLAIEADVLANRMVKFIGEHPQVDADITNSSKYQTDWQALTEEWQAFDQKMERALMLWGAVVFS